MKNNILKFLIVISFFTFPMFVQAQSGCCSHHGGVAGCNSDGRQICNDGTLSPSCTCTPPVQYGCTDISAKNYNYNANKDDGGCTYYIKGCTDINSINYNASAEKDDGSCIKKVSGCMDKNATNYNELANVNNDSCKYKEEIRTTISNKTENDTEENSDSSDLVTNTVGIGVLGASGYFIFKKIKKLRINS